MRDDGMEGWEELFKLVNIVHREYCGDFGCDCDGPIRRETDELYQKIRNGE